MILNDSASSAEAVVRQILEHAHESHRDDEEGWNAEIGELTFEDIVKSYHAIKERRGLCTSESAFCYRCVAMFIEIISNCFGFLMFHTMLLHANSRPQL
jgi:hypothetical protein